MSKECPVCGEDADAKAEVGSGQSWADVFGKPPHSLFSQYQAIHVQQNYDSQTAYLHRRPQV